MDALALLRLHIEWGADEALDDAPVDRLRAKLPPLPSTPAPPSAFAPVPALPSPLTPGVAARTPAERAASAAGLVRSVDELRAALAAFDGCALRDTA
ncbi:MAG TPA: uracil-DNA glycosylase, partial [Acetobacteraceae bacterium]